MKKNLLVLIFGVLCVFGTYEFVSAQVANTNSQTNTGSANTNSSNSTETPQKLEDPLGENTTIDKLLLSLFDIIFYIGVPVVAFFLIWSGFMFIAAQGNEGKLETAKSRLVWTVVGAILLLGAWTISQAIKGTIINIKKGATAYVHKAPFS